MNINTLRQFRYDIYDCFERAKDALFNTVDALMSRFRGQIAARSDTIALV